MEIPIDLYKCLNSFKEGDCCYTGKEISCDRTIETCKRLFSTKYPPIKIYPRLEKVSYNEIC